jgi:hypothetical protein
MNEPALVARLCRCEHPLLDLDSCLRCGRSVSAATLSEPQPARPPRKHQWTEAGVVRALRAFAFFRGRAPVRTDWSGNMARDWPSFQTVEGLFGSLPEALRAAGLDECRDSA